MMGIEDIDFEEIIRLLKPVGDGYNMSKLYLILYERGHIDDDLIPWTQKVFAYDEPYTLALRDLGYECLL